MSCPYCETRVNDFVPMNQTVEYSNIEIAINRQGMLRSRVFGHDGELIAQDIVEIHHCPLCGKQFTK